MGTTSDKLTYLNTTKTKIKDAINLANTSITNETFRLYEEKIKQAIINTMLDKWKVWDNFDKVSGSGTGLTLNNTHKAPLKLDLNENTYQYSTSGKNLFDLFGITPLVNKISYQRSNNSITQTNMGSYCRSMWEINDLIIGQNYTISCNFTNTSQCSLRLTINDSTNNTLIKQTDTTTLTTGTLSLTFEATETSCYIRIYSNTTDTANGYSVIFSNIQLEKSSTATEYEPYTNGASPNPDYPQDIHLVSGDNYLTIFGKNVWSSEWEQGQVDSSGNNATATDRIRTKDYIQVTPLQHYAIKRSIGTRFITVRCYDKNKTYLGTGEDGLNLIEGNTATNPMTNGDTTCVIQPKEGVYYLRFNDLTNDLTTQYMMVKGDTPQDYEAYTGQSQSISLGVKNYCSSVTKPANANLKFIIDKSISKTFTISFTTNEALNNNSLYLEVDGTGYGNLGGIIASANTRATKTYTLSNENYQAIQSGTTIDLLLYKNGANFDIPNDAQIEAGSKANSYSEYGKEPIKYCGIGDNKNKFIITSGKNLFDKENVNVLNAYITSGNAISSSNTAKTLYISCQPNTTYTISKKQSSRFAVAYSTDTPANDVTTRGVIQNNSATSMTITTDSNAKYLCVYYYHSSYDTTITEQQILDSIQIEQNNQATSYEPFGINEWWYKKAINKIVLDGSDDENWSIANNVFYSDFVSDYARTNNIPFSNYYKGVSNKASTTYVTTNNTICFGSLTANRLFIKNDSITSASDFKIWLNTHNTIVYYVLETPTYTKITDYRLLSQIKAIYNAISMQGVTNILQENNDLPFNIDASAIKEYE